jgi:diaminopropionate ammonia-lyase
MSNYSTYTNPSAKSWTCSSLTNPRILPFHMTLPDYNESPLTALPSVAKELGLKAVYIKDESQRFGLPAFKILGASWAVYRAVAEAAGLTVSDSSPDPNVEDVKKAAKQKGIKLVTTTEGNWGRAVAKMGKYLQLPTIVYVPRYMDVATQGKIRSEGAEVIVLPEEYEGALRIAREHSEKTNDLLVLDTSWDSYTEIPQWATEGYSTMLAEVDQQLAAHGSPPATLAVASVGVGSWAHAVVAHYKAKSLPAAVVTVEPTAAACLNTSLKAGEIVPIEIGDTIMKGMNCGTVSTIAWPYLRGGVDASVVIQDMDAHLAVQYLEGQGIKAGPCGAAPLAALKRIKLEGVLGLGEDDIVVLFCTEGAREYPVPEG